MQSASAQYREAITGDPRYILPVMIADFADPDVVYGAVTTSGLFPYTNPAQITHRETELEKHYFTLEPHRFLLDGFGQLYDGSPSATHQGVTLDPLSNAQAIFTIPQFAQRNFSNYHVLQVLSVNFSQDVLDGVGVDFTVDIYSGAGIIQSWNITNNSESRVFFTGFTAYEPTAVRVTFTRWSLPFRRARLASIILGVYEKWEADEIAKLDIMQQTDMANLSVPYGVATIEVENENKRFNPFQRAGVFESITERQSIEIYHKIYLLDGSFEKLPSGKYYLQNGGWETNAYEQTMIFRLVDIVGLLATRPFIMPSGPVPDTLSKWVAACVAHLGVNFINRYQVDAEIASTAITGTPDKTTCGDVLRYVCMTTSAFIRADVISGDLRISQLPTGGTEGGALINLDNQQYYPVNQARKDIASITFEFPNGTQHTVIGTNISAEDAINIKNPFLHNIPAAEAVARNILIHCGGTEFEVKGRGDLAAELGDIDRLETGFDTTITARRYKQQLAMRDGVLDHAPSWLYLGNGIELYERNAVLMGSGTFTVPPGVTSLRLIMVSGGGGGGAGEDGLWSREGTPGLGGLGGMVYTVTFNVSPGATFAYMAGLGGVAGLPGPYPPAQAAGQGQPSTFGSYSSAAGVRSDTGYADIYGGGVYGIRGRDSMIGEFPGPPGADGTGQGGGGGDGGWKGLRHTGEDEEGRPVTVTDRYPGKGQAGGRGGNGCIVVYFKKV
jgi:hypothetical protein